MGRLLGRTEYLDHNAPVSSKVPDQVTARAEKVALSPTVADGEGLRLRPADRALNGWFARRFQLLANPHYPRPPVTAAKEPHQ